MGHDIESLSHQIVGACIEVHRRLAGLPMALLVNFHGPTIKNHLRRYLQTLDGAPTRATAP